MSDEILLCTDGSPASLEALAAGLALLPPDPAAIVVVVIEPPDPMLVTGSGIAGGTMSPEDYDVAERAFVAEGEATVADAKAALGLDHATTLVLRGDPGAALCELAAERSARAIVLGTRGRGGFKRAFLGSVSDHVVRNAPCPVIVTNEQGSGA